jgi:large subunit ribosomal protein L25
MWTNFCEEYTMSETFTLKASPRTVVGKKVASLRRQGILPATVYGKGVDNLTIQVNSREFGLLFRKAGRTGVITLELEGTR